MNPTKEERLTGVILTLFQLNGALLDWGDAFVAPEALTSARWQMLGALALAGQPLSAPQVAAAMGVTRQGAQKQLNLLSEAQLVEVRPNPQHKRSPLYQLTDGGRRVYGAIDARWKERARQLAGGFSAAELETAGMVLAGLLAAHVPAPPEQDHET
ncbi:winged helix-turn-helix transcriptional regulator [Achromobacter sp. ACM02]|uniref:MarR family winged helix-turn-helix transcriptional regulator n=1 Tax=Achromobacter sp. ACM02 TaxID=2769305 RepID=UPI00177C90B8|nr:MarR family winged helix-turn-helix transcriptional regulator [Achromobacter sp. ACM02]MBD9384071.1 winged helix-turn-helix transcriptional regulator [Achromobacter sp. ACM02]